MNKPDVTKFFKDAKAVISKRSPEILTGLGIAGMISTTVLAVKATPKAMRLLEDAKKAKDDDKLTPVETVKAAWKPYVPAVATGVISTACLIGASSVNAKRMTALSAAYQLSSNALAEYKEKVVETIGEKKERAIRDKIAQDKADDEKRVNSTPLYVVDTNATEFYDPIGGARFVTTVEKLEHARNVINAMLIDSDFVSLNDFYYELGVPPVEIGYELGWNTNKGKRESMIDVHYTGGMDGKKPCAVLNYNIKPKYDYDKYFA